MITGKQNPKYKKPVITAEQDVFCRYCRQELGLNFVKEFQFNTDRKWRFDYAILQHKVAIEVEGGAYTNGRHTRGAGFIKDMEKYNNATSNGWKLLRVTPETLMNLSTFELIIKTLSLCAT